MLSNTLKLNFGCLNIIHILHPRYHPKNIVHILKNKQSVFVFIQLVLVKMKMKMKNRPHRYDVNRPKSKLDTNIVNIKSVSV